jgi:hypothetical protein
MDRALWRRYGLRFEIHPFDADWYSVGGIYIFSFFNRATQLWEVLYVGQTESYRNRLCLAHRQAVSGNGSGGHSRPCSVTLPSHTLLHFPARSEAAAPKRGAALPRLPGGDPRQAPGAWLGAGSQGGELDLERAAS